MGRVSVINKGRDGISDGKNYGEGGEERGKEFGWLCQQGRKRTATINPYRRKKEKGRR